MKIGLIQLDAHDKLWNAKKIPVLLDLAKDTDLVVFPECMPFDRCIAIDKARESLEKFAKLVAVTFIAGGYVTDEEGNRRNAVFLVHQGKVTGQYFKRTCWEGEKFKVGKEVKLFTWGKHACIPLICADAGEYDSQKKTLLMAEILATNEAPDVPIVICSYGGGLRTPYWHKALPGLAAGCEKPVVICGVSGRSKEFKYTDLTGHKKPFGGGGSGCFWPDGEINQVSFRGVLILDTASRNLEFRPIP